ncbi:MAG: DEAD/DEAH box helicase, partial [Polyangiaceae bacterium]|nr:DEAD/DEAH box helicase [Polyangiaceae bacterium]
MTAPLQEILPGTEVLARGLRWEVVHVRPAGDAALYRLRCLEGALQGRELDLVTPFERIDPLATPIDPARAAQLPAFRGYPDAFLLEQALGPRALLAAQPGRLRIAPYQLVPVMRALAMPRPRLLLADDVGLGKTVEAGLVLAELIARRRAHRILIACPAGPLLAQWQREMLERFGLRFRALDAGALQEIRYENELGANPFDHVALGIVSLDFAKQEKVLADIERSHFDVVIIDEAHHCASAGVRQSQDDSQRRKLAEVLARRGDALLLLTATPHDGVDEHFASLIALLDPSLLAVKDSLRGERYKAHVVRRLKRHIVDPRTDAPLFRERQVVPERVALEGAPGFAAFHEALLALVLPALKRALRRRAFDDVLAFIALLKRSVSTARAAASTIEVVRRRLDELSQKKGEAQEARKQRLRTLQDLVRRRERFGTLSFEEEQDQAALEAEDIAAELAEAGTAELEGKLAELRREGRRERERMQQIQGTRDALARLLDIAADAAAEDPKLRVLLEQIQAIRREEPRANVLVYTEYTDSLEAVSEALAAAAGRGELTGEILSIRGEHADAERERVTRAFTTRDDIVLASTDASAEGLNLHARCHHLIHVELPYNPNRLEQRNGRIDRFGQTHDPVVRYLYLGGTFEERLLFRLVEKYERQRRRLGFMPNTLGISTGDLMGGRLLEGLVEDEGGLFGGHRALVKKGQPADDTSSPAYRDMLSEIDRVFVDFERAARAHEWLGDAGLAADRRTLDEAAEARARGDRLGAVELVEFVREAVRADSAEPKAAVEDPHGVITLKLPPEWLHGLDELPGYDATARTLRVSRDIEREVDAEGRPVAYLGRAHPIVRRALDRVRNVQFGGGALLDRRVAAARGDGPEPEVVHTYLGQIRSQAGRELERVIAVRRPRGAAPRAVAEVSEWIGLTDLARALPPAGVWDAQFKSWARVVDPEAQQAAAVAFAAMAEEFLRDQRAALERERAELASWLRLRAEAICGPPGKQMDLFAAGPAPAARPWQVLTDDLERLSAFATDGGRTPRERTEAHAVVKIHADRIALIDRRAATDAPRVLPLGL